VYRVSRDACWCPWALTGIRGIGNEMGSVPRCNFGYYDHKTAVKSNMRELDPVGIERRFWTTNPSDKKT
jgi:hypothetical protein